MEKLNIGAKKLGLHLAPEQLKDKSARVVHVRFAADQVTEEQFLRLRDFIVGRPGECGVCFHIQGNGENRDVVIKASPHITLSADEGILEEVRGHPLVEDVWRE